MKQWTRLVAYSQVLSFKASVLARQSLNEGSSIECPACLRSKANFGFWGEFLELM